MIVFIFGVLSDEDRYIINQIFTKYHTILYSKALTILHNTQDAEDAVEQTFLKLIKKTDTLKKIPCNKILPYCVIVTKNTSIDIYRNNRKTVPIEFIEEIQETVGDTTEELFFRNQDNALLLNHLKKLPSDDKYLLELRWGANMSYRDIGMLMNITEPTARKRVQRALQKMQKLYLGGEYINV